MSMLETAEIVAERYGISRAAQTISCNRKQRTGQGAGEAATPPRSRR